MPVSQKDGKKRPAPEAGKKDRKKIDPDLVSAVFSLTMSAAMMAYYYKTQLGGSGRRKLVKKSRTKFSDIIGHEEIIEDVRFITELVKNPKMGKELGAKPPKGLLLVGPPGTGKTLIAKAIAGEAHVPFLYQNASAFVEMYVGLGAKRVRELFDTARRVAPCIVFIDEIDAVGARRSSRQNNSENEQTINALLQEMDGFTGREGVFVIAATNKAETLDEALVRSGRFDRQITVNPPRDYKVRRALFECYLKDLKVDPDLDLDNISRQVSGFTGADIAAVCNEAGIIAMMKKKPQVDADCIEEAIDKKIFKGNRSRKKEFEADREIVAFHEAGHAVMSYLCHEPIARASIISTISGVGGAVFNQDKERQFRTAEEYKNQVLIAYAGRAAEELRFGSVTGGAVSDITQATEIMLAYVEKLGFCSEFGMIDMDVLSSAHLISGEAVTEKVGEISRAWYEECREKLRGSFDKVERLAAALLKEETLSGTRIEAIIKEEA